MSWLRRFLLPATEPAFSIARGRMYLAKAVRKARHEKAPAVDLNLEISSVSIFSCCTRECLSTRGKSVHAQSETDWQPSSQKHPTTRYHASPGPSTVTNLNSTRLTYVHTPLYTCILGSGPHNHPRTKPTQHFIGSGDQYQAGKIETKIRRMHTSGCYGPVGWVFSLSYVPSFSSGLEVLHAFLRTHALGPTFAKARAFRGVRAV